MHELDTGNERIKAICPECGKQYTSLARHIEHDTRMVFVPRYGRAYAILCQPCQDAIIPNTDIVQAPPSRHELLRAELLKGFQLMKNGKPDQASAEYLFVIANLLLDLTEGERPSPPAQIE